MEFKTTQQTYKQLRDSSLKNAGTINHLNIKQVLLPSISVISWDGELAEMSLYLRKEVVLIESG